MADQTRSLEKLELPAILDQLAALCGFSLAAERARELGPSAEPGQVTKEIVKGLSQLDEGLGR